jgi:hypothetical protein
VRLAAMAVTCALRLLLLVRPTIGDSLLVFVLPAHFVVTFFLGFHGIGFDSMTVLVC